MFFGTGFICMVLAALVAWMWSAKYRDRADTYDLDLVNDLQVPNMIYDREKSEVGRIFNENRDPIPVGDVPQLFIDTLIAAEDARFFSHDGYDLKGITRVALQEVKGGSTSGGASTLTQQLARNAYYLQDERKRRKESTYERKLVEIFLAIRIEERYTKQDILEFYLNRVNFGGGFYGIRSASLGFFGKEPKDLEIHECAALVGSIRNPAHYCPTSLNTNAEGERERGYENKLVKNRVLIRMGIEGMINAEERDEYMKRPLELNPDPIRRGTSHFYDRVAEKFDQLMSENGISEIEKAKGGYKIFTTIDKDVQEMMERDIKKKLISVERQEGYEHPKYVDYVKSEDSKPAYLQGAGMMMNNETGEVIAYVGGRDFEQSQYDFIESGRKPLGTAFFPFIYTSALENGMNSSTQLIDEAMDNRQVMIDGVEGILGEWGHEVASPKYEGYIPMRRALAASKIAATVRLGRKIGLEGVWNTSEKFGLKRPEGKLLNRTLLGSEDASITELVKAYSAFPNGGEMVKDLVWISHIADASGALVYQWNKESEVKTDRVMSDSSAFLVNKMLEDAIKNGSGSDVFKAAKMENFQGGGKTGTTSDFSNHWFVGYNGNVTCALWSGFYDGVRKEIYTDAFSKETVMPVWLDVMRKAQEKMGIKSITQPEDVVKLRICSKSGKLESRACEEHVRNIVTGENGYKSTGYEEYFHIDQRPKGACPVHGASLGDFHSDFQASESQLSPIERLNMVPIKPKEPTLVGEDPYKSIAPIYAPRQKSIYRAGRGLGSMDFDLLDEQNSASEIELMKPLRMVITD
ncbi:MAG: membrane peptidoglycan carboxypeptidase [Cryomorphaceae bacterium]|jgi:membrane peptidoglycan carboxypeptidase